MDSMPVDDMNVMDDPEGGCIVQADDPQMLAAAAFDGVGSSGNNSWYWTSMLKLMEQGTAPSSCMSTSTHNINNNYTPGAPYTPGQQHTPPPSASSPSSSSVHDQPIDMLTQNNAINASDPDNSVWAQEFLSGPIGENKTSSIACSDDGLHELLYPRTVLELLFSDQLKLEQMPSWPDILQAHTATSGPAKTFGFPLTSSDKIVAGSSAAQDNVSLDNPQLDSIKFTQYLHLSGIDDRLSSSTASSTLSDNAIDQWAAPQAGSSGAQCENMQAHPGAMQPAHSSPLSNNMQQFDPRSVKQEYNHEPSPPFSSNDNNYSSQYNIIHHQPHNQRNMMANQLNIAEAGNGFEESMMNNELYEQKPNLLSMLWNPGVINANDPLTHVNHKHHIYESITAANFSHANLRQIADLTAKVHNFQSAINIPAGHSQLQSYNINQPYQPSLLQLAKKSRPFHDLIGGASGTSSGAAVDEESIVLRKDELLQRVGSGDEDSKPTNNIAMAAGTDIEAGANNMLAMHMQQQQQLSGTEYNFKRTRIEQPAAPPPTSSTSTSTTNSTSSSSSSFKGQPVRKEKLSEQIATLQQLVSPFGKTDTASVLLEAIGYIKFLQEQVQALSSPYFKSPTSQSGDRSHNGEESKPDLKSRGLCLVPLSCTMQVANDNGADYWYGGTFR